MNDSPNDGFRDRPLWLLGLAALVLAQAGLVLALFGPGRTWTAVIDDRPILSGRHPLHLYHGTLGRGCFPGQPGPPPATTLPSRLAIRKRRSSTAGVARPNSSSHWGRRLQPGGLQARAVRVPAAGTGRVRRPRPAGPGCPPEAAVLAGAGRDAAWLVGASAADDRRRAARSARRGACRRSCSCRGWHGSRRPSAWMRGGAGSRGAGGWYFHPLVWLGLTPIVLVYYLVFAPRHGPAWHLGLAGITFAGIAPNVWWLVGLGEVLVAPPAIGDDQIPLPDWRAVLGGPADYRELFGGLPGDMAVLIAGIAGMVLLWRRGIERRRGCPVLAVGLAVAAARVAAAWPAVLPGTRTA